MNHATTQIKYLFWEFKCKDGWTDGPTDGIKAISWNKNFQKCCGIRIFCNFFSTTLFLDAVAAGAAASVVCIYYVLGALTLGQRANRELASDGKNRGSRAGEHEQPNAGRKRKRRVFLFCVLLVERCRTREGKA